MKKIMVIAPHPDDETLGCGGTLLRHLNQHDEIHWLILTGINEEMGYSSIEIESASTLINNVKLKYQFKSVHCLTFPPAQLDTIPVSMLVSAIGDVFNKIKPEILYLPFRYDIHTDHSYAFDAIAAATKWFRYPYVRRILVYETLSETDFSLSSAGNSFNPNVFVDISSYLEKKIEIMKLYKCEMKDFPFPRSEEAIISLARIRGVAAGFKAAEAFQLLKEIVD